MKSDGKIEISDFELTFAAACAKGESLIWKEDQVSRSDARTFENLQRKYEDVFLRKVFR